MPASPASAASPGAPEPSPDSSPGAPRPLSATALRQWLEGEAPPQLVDVREDAELSLARLPYPVLHLPLSRSQEWMAGLEAQLDPSRPVVVLCHAGVRSWHLGCWLLQERGCLEVWNLSGGIDAWSVEVDGTVPRY